MAGAYFGCLMIVAALIWGLGVGHEKLDEIIKAIKNHNTQSSTESNDCEPTPEKDLNDSCLCGTVPS